MIAYENSFSLLGGASIDTWGEYDNAQQQNRSTHLPMEFFILGSEQPFNLQVLWPPVDLSFLVWRGVNVGPILIVARVLPYVCKVVISGNLYEKVIYGSSSTNPPSGVPVES